MAITPYGIVVKNYLCLGKKKKNRKKNYRKMALFLCSNSYLLSFHRYAPESLAYGKFSVQSDVWSFGVTLYEMFSRGLEPNFVSGDQTLLLRALQQGRRLPCPPGCKPLIYRDLMKPCWDAEASQRPSFKALLDKLRCVANQL